MLSFNTEFFVQIIKQYVLKSNLHIIKCKVGLDGRCECPRKCHRHLGSRPFRDECRRQAMCWNRLSYQCFCCVSISVCLSGATLWFQCPQIRQPWLPVRMSASQSNWTPSEWQMARSHTVGQIFTTVLIGSLWHQSSSQQHAFLPPRLLALLR